MLLASLFIRLASLLTVVIIPRVAGFSSGTKSDSKLRWRYQCRCAAKSNMQHSSFFGSGLQNKIRGSRPLLTRKSKQIFALQEAARPCVLSRKTHFSTKKSRCAFLGTRSKPQKETAREEVKVQAASGYGADDLDAKRRNRLPPSLFMRILAAFFYVVPWLDILSLGWEYHRRFPTSILFLTTVDQLIGVYYSSQFAPLIIFFLLFLSVVKNFRIHHFTRFHCMQSIVLDIVTMLFTLVRTYFPGEIRWSPVMNWFDMFAYNMCMCTIIYCIGCALLGYYADVTYVSESTYMQVEEG